MTFYTASIAICLRGRTNCRNYRRYSSGQSILHRLAPTGNASGKYTLIITLWTHLCLFSALRRSAAGGLLLAV